jgi:hypothetical protein
MKQLAFSLHTDILKILADGVFIYSSKRLVRRDVILCNSHFRIILVFI